MPEGPYGHPAKAGKLPYFQLVFTHNNCALLLSGDKDTTCRRVRVKRKMNKVKFFGTILGQFDIKNPSEMLSKGFSGDSHNLCSLNGLPKM
jgi:hypothetical protein